MVVLHILVHFWIQCQRVHYRLLASRVRAECPASNGACRLLDVQIDSSDLAFQACVVIGSLIAGMVSYLVNFGGFEAVLTKYLVPPALSGVWLDGGGSPVSLNFVLI